MRAFTYEFRHTNQDHTGPFSIEAEFMNREERGNLLEHLLLDFRKLEKRVKCFP
jgi:hypothetical protein